MVGLNCNREGCLRVPLARERDMPISKTFEDEIKCGGCNYRVSILYGHEGTNFEPDKDGLTDGLCAECFLETLMTEEEVKP